MIENNLRANKHIHYTYTDKDLIDSLRSNQGIPERQDIIMAFNSGYYGPDFLVLDYENNAVFEYTDIDASDWVKKIKIPNLSHFKPLIEYLKSSIFTFDYRVNPVEELEFCLTTYGHATYTLSLDGPNQYVIVHRQADGQVVSSDRFAFKDIKDVNAFDIEFLKLLSFEHEIRNDNSGVTIVLKKQNQHFEITYRRSGGFKSCFADLTKNQIYQMTSEDKRNTLEFMLIFSDKEISDLYLKQWMRVLQMCYIPEYNKTLLSNLEKNTPFLKWK